MLSFESKCFIKSNVRFFVGDPTECVLIVWDLDNPMYFNIVVASDLVRSVSNVHVACDRFFCKGFEYIKINKYNPADFISDDPDIKWSEIVEHIVADVVSIIEDHSAIVGGE